jgi:AraC-like DNA-binding protein
VRSITFRHVPPCEDLEGVVEHFRIAEYAGSEGTAIKVCPNGLPGLVFQHHNGDSAIKCIVTNSGRIVHLPTLFLHGQITELAVMNFKSGPYLSVQAVLKPHALRPLFGMDASTLTNANRWYPDFSGEELNAQLVNAKSGQECVELISTFLLAELRQVRPRDRLVEESVRFIHENIKAVTVKDLLRHLHISERQFEKRFMRAVGITPQFYIRVKRFNEAIRLMDTGEYERLSDVAYALNFHDQSHFIRDIKQFSGITPKNISQKVNQFHHDQIGASYFA